MKKRNKVSSGVETKKVLLLGLPNTGKTQVFYNLTGQYNVVANYPMTTIETRSADMTAGGVRYTVTDTPGLHGIFIHSEEEALVRDIIIRDTPDIVIQCIDANRLKVSLYLTAELAELNIPFVISLNAIDETERKGKLVDAKKLSELLGVPVVESVATENRGTAELKKALESAAVSGTKPSFPKQITDFAALIRKILPEDVPCADAAALLILQQDPYILTGDGWINGQSVREHLSLFTKNLCTSYFGNFNRIIVQRRNAWVDEIESAVARRSAPVPDTFLEKLATITRKPITGIPVLFAILAASYFAVVYGAGALSELLVRYLQDPVVGLLDRFISPGFLNDFLIGHYGIITLGLFNAICTVLPILSVFFIIFGFLEDVGYLPNLAILVKKILSRIGLTGKSLMSLVLGFGCKTMATLTVKSIPSRKERIIAVYLIAFGIPCSAQLGLNIAILGRSGLMSFFIVLAFLALVELGAGAILNRIIKDDQKTSFIQELPAFRSPNIKGLLTKTYFRLLWFLKESLFIFIAAAAVLFFMDFLGVLDFLKTVLHPVIVRWLGLPVDMVDALILTMARHEVAAGLILNLSNAGKLNIIQSIIAVTITTMFVPCIANVVAIFKEMGVKAGIAITLSINISSFILAGILNWILVLIFGKI